MVRTTANSSVPDLPARWGLKKGAPAGCGALSRLPSASPAQNRQHPALTLSSIMLESIAIVLLIFWLLGLVSSYTLGGFIHILLVLAIISVLLRLIRGRSL